MIPKIKEYNPAKHHTLDDYFADNCPNGEICVILYDKNEQSLYVGFLSKYIPDTGKHVVMNSKDVGVRLNTLLYGCTLAAMQYGEFNDVKHCAVYYKNTIFRLIPDQRVLDQKAMAFMKKSHNN